MARQVAELYLSDQMREQNAEGMGNDNTIRDLGADNPDVSFPGNHLEDYVGDYDLGTGVVLSVSTSGDRLVLNTSGQDRFNLIPTANDRYVVEGGEQQISFERDTTGTVTDITVQGLGPTVSAPRAEIIHPDSVQLSDYVGTFYAEELGTSYTLEVVADTLIATHLRLGSISLVPRGRDAFFGNRWFFLRLAFERDNNGQVIAFRASNGRVRSLLFEKQGRSR